MTDLVEPLLEPQPANQLHSAAGYQSGTRLLFLIDHRVLLGCYVNHLKEGKKRNKKVLEQNRKRRRHIFQHTPVCSVSVCGGSD